MLANRLALITGGASGIGYAIAQTFAKQGASIALVDIASNLKDAVKELEKQTGNENLIFSAHVCDVSDGGQVKNLFNEIKEQHSSHLASIIVNSAGITRDSVLVKMNEKQFDQVISVNLKGTFLVSQAAAQVLIENFDKFDSSNPLKSYASIINFSSVVAKFGNIGQTNYSAAKTGVEGLTRNIALELGKYKIRCNSILPGFIKTPMTDKVPEKHLKQMLSQVPLKRVGLPEDVAQLALFLASDASSYITGNSIDCNGGLSY